MSEIVSETLREVTPGLDDGNYSVLSCLKENRLYLAEKAGKRLILKTPGSNDIAALELLKREYELSVNLSHSSLSYVFTWEERSPVGPCLIQEYVDGLTLGEWLSGKPSLRERRRIFNQLLSAVSYLHRKGIVHNDLTPANILVTRTDNDLKLIDLGFADHAGHIAHSLGGTRGYASPELLAGAVVDARSDIWSLGVLLRECFPRRYGRIVRRCLRTDPQRRYASVDALDRALRHHGRTLRYVALGLLLLLLGWFAYSYLDMRAGIRESRTQWESLQEAGAAERDELAEAKAAIDAWYENEIPVFRNAMLQATSQKDVNDAWMALVDKMIVINDDIPNSAPEEIRPTIRDYLFERYNAVFPDLQAEMIARNSELN